MFLLPFIRVYTVCSLHIKAFVRNEVASEKLFMFPLLSIKA